MHKNKKLMILLSVLSLMALGFGFTAAGLAHWYPPGGSTVP